MEKVCDFLTKAGTFYFLTTADGKPRGRPFGVYGVKDGKLVLATGTHKACYREMLANPNVEVVATCGMTFMRIDGTAEPFDDAEFEKDMRAKHPFFDQIYNEQTGLKICFFFVKDAHVEIITSMKVDDEFSI